MAVFKDAFHLYRRTWWILFIIGLLIIIPIQLGNLLFSNYFYGLYEMLGIPIMGMFIGALISIVVLTLIQVPLIQIAFSDWRGEEVKAADIIKAFLENMFSVYVLALIYTLFVFVGTSLLVIPGLIALVLFFTIPYTAIIEKERWRGALKRSFFIGKTHFFTIFLLILLFGGAQWLIESIVLLGSLFVFERFIWIALIQIVLSTLILPIFVFVMTYLYLDWIDADVTDLVEGYY